MNTSELMTFIAAQNDDALAEAEGMVYQVWEDGEVTLQKCGDLLWQRNLHTTQFGFLASAPATIFPHKHGEHGYAFVTKEGAEKVREAIREWLRTGATGDE